MSWQKFSDRARESRKVRRASSDAIVLWWAIGNWCCEHKTDGFIAKDEVEDAWRPIGRRFPYSAALQNALQVGLLTDHGDHYEVHDFLEFNPSKEQDDERKQRDAKRAAAYRARQKTLNTLGTKSGITELVTANVTRDDACDEARDSHGTARERHTADVTGDPSGVRHAPFDPTRPVPSRKEGGGEHVDMRAGLKPLAQSSSSLGSRTGLIAARVYGEALTESGGTWAGFDHNNQAFARIEHLVWMRQEQAGDRTPLEDALRDLARAYCAAKKNGRKKPEWWLEWLEELFSEPLPRPKPRYATEEDFAEVGE